MPDEPSVLIEVHAGAGVRTTTFRGPLNDVGLSSALTRLMEAPDFDPALSDVIDLRAVTSWDVSRSGLGYLIGRLAELDRLGLKTRTALVVGSEVAYGLGRMYELMRGSHEGSTEEVRVFRDPEQAFGWASGHRSAED